MTQKSDPSIQQFALFVLQFALPIFDIQTLSDSLLYTVFVVVFFMPLLTII